MRTSAPDEELLRQARIVRELGSRTPGTYLARAPNETDVVLETYTNVSAGEIAQRLIGVRHPHLVTVLSVERTSASCSVATEHVDGVPLADVFHGLSLGGRLRAVVDVLTALSALHVVTDNKPIIHCGKLLGAAFIEKTGRTKLGFAYRAPLCFGKDSYAPEVLVRDKSAIDARTDVYGAGVLLWEALTGRALFGDDPPEQIIKRQLAGRVARALPAASDRWARSVVPVVDRALAVDPKDRFATIAEMAAALRIAVRARLMIHDDIVEEVWPAETVPRHSSGVQPKAAPVAEERPKLEQPTSEMKIAIEPKLAPAPAGVVVAPASSPSRLWLLFPVAILAAGLAVAVFVLLHAHHDPMPASLATTTRQVVEPARITSPTATPTLEVPAATLVPTAAPEPPQPKPTKHTHTPAKASGTYDPASI